MNIDELATRQVYSLILTQSAEPYDGYEQAVVITVRERDALVAAVRAAVEEAEEAERGGRDGNYLISFFEALAPFRAAVVLRGGDAR